MTHTLSMDSSRVRQYSIELATFLPIFHFRSSQQHYEQSSASKMHLCILGFLMCPQQARRRYGPLTLCIYLAKKIKRHRPLCTWVCTLKTHKAKENEVSAWEITAKKAARCRSAKICTEQAGRYCVPITDCMFQCNVTINLA